MTVKTTTMVRFLIATLYPPSDLALEIRARSNMAFPTTTTISELLSKRRILPLDLLPSDPAIVEGQNPHTVFREG
jgi:hypothetical protein